MAKVLEATTIYAKLKQELKKQIKALPQLTLASLSVGQSYSRDVYLWAQKKLAQELGVNYVTLALSAGISLKDTLNKLSELNKDNKITGIIANKPFPKGFNEETIFCAIDFKKDIEGMHPYNLGYLFIGEPKLVSPTVLSILEFLEMAKIKFYGKEVTIIGFSTLIGKPLALLLGRKFATVNITHIATYERKRLRFYVRNADILISAVGKPNFIKGNWIKNKATVIDVGIGERNGKIIGDIDFESVKSKAAFITPVLGGVGKLTSLFLFQNLVKAHKMYHG
jgi:methylenetetrahydrofolate dehydrogenase (NADP+)/methenyltetrahydrofolate cyclohydrolase